MYLNVVKIKKLKKYYKY